MYRVFRIALMWLVALAVPLQGVAAATMMACGPSHAPAAQGQAQADHDAALHAPVEHAHHHGAVAHHDMGANDGHAVKTAPQKCSVCASCCTATMLPTALPSLPTAAVPDFVVPRAPSDVALFLTDGPERPPRILLD